MDGIKNGVPQTFQEHERLRKSNNIQFVAEAFQGAIQESYKKCLTFYLNIPFGEGKVHTVSFMDLDLR